MKTKPKKPTQAQYCLLMGIFERPFKAASYYPPAKVCVREGWAEWKGDYLHITPKGKKAADITV